MEIFDIKTKIKIQINGLTKKYRIEIYKWFKEKGIPYEMVPDNADPYHTFCIGPKWPRFYYFGNKNDALLFKLTWM